LCRAMCLHIVGQCQELLDAMPTSREQDMQLLKETWPGGSNEPWTHSQHQQLALAYRIARKQTLQAVVMDVGALARLLSADDTH